MNKFAAFVTTTMFMLNQRLENKDKGATMVEYGIMVALIAAVSIALIVILGDQVKAGFDKIADALAGPTGVANP